MGDLSFALLWEPIGLCIPAAAFDKEPQLFGRWIKVWACAQPHNPFTRRAWFLFEFLRGAVLDQPDSAPMNYVPLLDHKRQLTLDPAPIRSSRHRIDANLMGARDFCPLIRRTPEIDAINLQTVQETIADLMRKLIILANTLLKAGQNWIQRTA